MLYGMSLILIIQTFHYISLFANDSANNINSSFINFSIKSSNPNLIILNPVNNTNYSTNTITLNYSSIDASLDKTWYELDSNNTNITVTTNLTFNNLADRYHNITLWNNDTADNTNRSYVSFLIDTIPTNINIVNPLNNTVIANTTINVNYTYGADVNVVWYELDSNNTNISLYLLIC